MKKGLELNGSSSSLDCEEVIKELFWEYAEYEQKITSSYDIIIRLRDYYYLHYTGKKYEEWLDEKSGRKRTTP